MKRQDDLLGSLVLDEIEGKNKAIHAYDGMVWKIRSGFLTLLFAGWAYGQKIQPSANDSE
jgi:hypothetical protein